MNQTKTYIDKMVDIISEYNPPPKVNEALLGLGQFITDRPSALKHVKVKKYVLTNKVIDDVLYAMNDDDLYATVRQYLITDGTPSQYLTCLKQVLPYLSNGVTDG